MTMIDFQRILVPTDFSSCARFALDFGLAFATRCGGSVYLLHTFELPLYVRPDLAAPSADVNRNLAEEVRLAAETRMSEFLRETHFSEHPNVHSEVVQGSPATAILEAAEKGNFDLITMGTHGRSGLSHMMLGSVAEKVVRTARCPVLTVRSRV